MADNYQDKFLVADLKGRVGSQLDGKVIGSFGDITNESVERLCETNLK